MEIGGLGGDPASERLCEAAETSWSRQESKITKVFVTSVGFARFFQQFPKGLFKREVGPLGERTRKSNWVLKSPFGAHVRWGLSGFREALLID